MLRREPGRGGQRRAPGGPRGVTLVELLVVMGIIALVTTMGILSQVGITRRNSREGAIEQVIAVVRQARVSAVEGGRGAVVRIDPADGALYGLSTEIVAAWHFEETVSGGGSEPDRTPGARSMDAELLDGDSNGGFWNDPPTIYEYGALGRCLSFNFDLVNGVAQPGWRQYVDCGSYPVYELADGIRAEAYVRPGGAANVGDRLGVIQQRETSRGWSLWLECDDTTGAQEFSLRCLVSVEHDLQDVVGGGNVGKYFELDSRDARLPGFEWSHVALEFDGFEGRLSIDGVLVDSDELLEENDEDPNDNTDREYVDVGQEPPSQLRPGPLVSLEVGRHYNGLGYDYFTGQIDEPRLLAVAGGERTTLPRQVGLFASERVIHFDPQGYLDMAHHTGEAFVAVGDPYQSAELVSFEFDPPPVSGLTMTVRARNPFRVGPQQNTGQDVLMVGTEGVYEMMRYVRAEDLTLRVYDIETETAIKEQRGQFGSEPLAHSAGETVYFGRVARIAQTGLVERER
jgi:prepilin-type N-terminal cleavage/methylation domain-containing protein